MEVDYASIAGLTKLSRPNRMTSPLIGVVMGSSSDWDTMQHAVQILTQFGVPHEAQVVSAHRTPDLLFQ